ncbi:hypothetical protein [Pontivivens insulae]|uniref:Lipoprotein n=1 Tax=Pontivivens insulae TaxID=1639689 RepID=A0A2R8AB07_9RHOB|nr:hypothetical protein [Pontivivens insulae]RED13330.1 hypothetical protein DFR53_2466 [Pontivivens insulae]SPF29422.1 hypothetical protein POI8812_01731 [Pontivivens insulae]
MFRTLLALTVVATLAACGAPDQMSFVAAGDHPMADVNVTPVPVPHY